MKNFWFFWDLAFGLVYRIMSKKYLWSSYDAEGDVLYINFKKPSHATDSELTSNDIIVRYAGKEVVGVTILNATKNKKRRILKWAAR